MEEVLDAKAITDKLGIGKNAVYALMKKKGFPSIKVGRKYIVFADDFERYMKNHIGTTLYIDDVSPVKKKKR